MLVMERVLPKLPAALLAVVSFSVLGVLIGAEARGVAMVGEVPAGLPGLTIPTLSTGEVGRLAATAAGIAVVILAQSAAVARSFATKNGYRDNTNQDLYALAAANTGSALTGGFAINGSPPRTAAGDAAGSRSQMVNIVMALVIAFVLLFATGLFEYLPSPVLDAVVFAIGIGLVKVAQLRAIRRTRLFEFGAALLAAVVVAFVGVEQGILIAVLVSLVDRLRRQYRRRTRCWSPMVRSPHASGTGSMRAPSWTASSSSGSAPACSSRTRPTSTSGCATWSPRRPPRCGPS